MLSSIESMKLTKVTKMSKLTNDPLRDRNLKIVKIRPLTTKELASEHWDTNSNVTCLVLSNGTKLYASQDSEGNGPGTMFGTDVNGRKFGLGG
jgi:hypothetical protein